MCAAGIAVRVPWVVKDSTPPPQTPSPVQPQLVERGKRLHRSSGHFRCWCCDGPMVVMCDLLFIVGLRYFWRMSCPVDVYLTSAVKGGIRRRGHGRCRKRKLGRGITVENQSRHHKVRPYMKENLQCRGWLLSRLLSFGSLLPSSESAVKLSRSCVRPQICNTNINRDRCISTMQQCSD